MNWPASSKVNPTVTCGRWNFALPWHVWPSWQVSSVRLVSHQHFECYHHCLFCHPMLVFDLVESSLSSSFVCLNPENVHVAVYHSVKHTQNMWEEANLHTKTCEKRPTYTQKHACIQTLSRRTTPTPHPHPTPSRTHSAPPPHPPPLNNFWKSGLSMHITSAIDITSGFSDPLDHNPIICCDFTV